MTDIDGGDGFLHSGNLVAGGAAVQAQLLELVARHTSEAELAAGDLVAVGAS